MKPLLVATLVTSLSLPAFAGPDGTFLCSSAQPYDFLTADTSDYRSYGVRTARGWSRRQEVTGQLIAGQGVKALSADGLMLVPLKVGNEGWVELHKQGRVLARIHGYIHMWDLWSDGTRERFMFTIWDGVDRGDAPPLTATETQMRYIVDGDGKVLVKQPYEESTDPEDSVPPLLFTADGKTLYQVTDLAPTARMYNAADLNPIGMLQAPEGSLIGGLALLSADNGFAIASGKLFRVSAGKLVPFELSGPFEAQVLQMDTRSRRILVEGANDFIVLDFSGNILFRFADQAPVAAEPRWISARLAIDGSVGLLREGEPLARVLAQNSNYRESRLTPLGERDWNRVACFTANSAALWVDDKPLLVKF